MINEKNQGFTLIEATIAIAVLAVGLFAVTQFFPFGLKIIGDSNNLTTASNIALSKIEELVSSNYDELNLGTVETKHRLSTDSASYLYNYQRQTVIGLVDSNFNASPTDVGLKKITVTVYWLSPIGLKEKSIIINSLKAKN